MSEIYLVNTVVPDLRIGPVGAELDEISLSVGEQPRYFADFAFAATEGRVDFSDASYATSDASGDPHTVSWDFGDGSTSTSPNPTHTYATSGSYTVRLTSSWAARGASASSSKAVEVAIWAASAVTSGASTPPFYSRGTRLLNSADSLVYTASAGTWGSGVPIVEGPNSLYDAGQPLDIYAELSKFGLTEQQRQDVLAQHNFYLQGGQAPVTAAQWASLRAAIAGDPNPGLVTDDFGFPAIGMGIDIVERPENSASASITETMMMRAIDRGNPLESHRYDVGLLDQIDENVAVMYAGGMPPIPSGGIPAGSTYESFETPLTAADEARVFEISFSGSPAAMAALSPTFSIWLPDTPAPVQVSVVERVKPGVFRFSLARPTPAKIIVG